VSQIHHRHIPGFWCREAKQGYILILAKSYSKISSLGNCFGGQSKQQQIHLSTTHRQLKLSVWGQHILGSNLVPDSDFKQTPLKTQVCTDVDFIFVIILLFSCQSLQVWRIMKQTASIEGELWSPFEGTISAKLSRWFTQHDWFHSFLLVTF